jgi:hypothetical protein
MEPSKIAALVLIFLINLCMLGARSDSLKLGARARKVLANLGWTIFVGLLIDLTFVFHMNLIPGR